MKPIELRIRQEYETHRGNGMCREAAIRQLETALPDVLTVRVFIDREYPAGPLDNYYLGGEFTSFQHWVNKAASWIGGRYAVCADAKGRICGLGYHFKIAEEQGAFPVKFYFPLTREAVDRNARDARDEHLG